MNISNHGHYSDQSFTGLQAEIDEIIGCEFINCKFRNINFSGLQFRECRFINCEFSECDLSLLQVPESSFSGVSFRDTKLVGVDWTRANWGREFLGESLCFVKSILSHSTFIGLTMINLRIEDCIAHNVDFRETDLSKSDFSGTDLTDSLFLNTNLTKANLATTQNYQISPEVNILTDARFSFPEALSLLYSMDIHIEGEIQIDDPR